MSLTLGKSFDRSYNARIPFLNGFYNIGVFFNKKSTFLLFSINPDFSKEYSMEHGSKINMFKNLESSMFCETFLNLHNYRKNTLDILNQFENIKSEYHDNISFILNESLTLSKVEIGDRTFYDTLNIYGFTMNTHMREFIFLIAERHNIIRRLGKKIVRTTAVQIATGPSIELLNEFHQESITSGRAGFEPIIDKSHDTINLSQIDEEINNG